MPLYSEHAETNGLHLVRNQMVGNPSQECFRNPLKQMCSMLLHPIPKYSMYVPMCSTKMNTQSHYKITNPKLVVQNGGKFYEDPTCCPEGLSTLLPSVRNSKSGCTTHVCISFGGQILEACIVFAILDLFPNAQV